MLALSPYIDAKRKEWKRSEAPGLGSVVGLSVTSKTPMHPCRVIHDRLHHAFHSIRRCPGEPCYVLQLPNRNPNLSNATLAAGSRVSEAPIWKPIIMMRSPVHGNVACTILGSKERGSLVDKIMSSGAARLKPMCTLGTFNEKLTTMEYRCW